jgi:hypothetical protein
VEVYQCGTGTALAEYDVSLLFENGRLLILECKAGAVMSRPDGFARIAKLRKVGGEGGDMVVCAPLFGPEDTSRENADLQKKAEEFRTFGIPFLAYDEGQRFEESLKGLMERHALARAAAQAKDAPAFVG